MKKKKVYNVPKKVVKKNNQRLAAFVLLGFFIFTFIGSVLGIIGFVRTSKKDSALNVVSASANVITDFYNQETINLVDYMDKSPLTIDGNNTVASQFSSNGQYYIQFLHNDQTNYVDQVICPLTWICSEVMDYMEQGVLLAFRSQDYGFDFSLGYQEDNLFQIESMRYKRLDDGSYVWYEYIYPEYPYFLLVSNHDLENVVALTNVSVKPIPVYTGYDYTYNEFYEIFEQDLLNAYNEGLTANDGYQQGITDGYNQALDDIYATLQGIFSFADWDVSVNTVTNNNVTYNGFDIERFRGMRFVNRQTIDLSNSIKSVFNEMGLLSDIVDYRYNSVIFKCYNFAEPIPQFLRFTLGLSSTFTIEDVERYFDSICFVDSNNQPYWVQYEQLSGSSYSMSFDFSTMLPGAYIQRMEIGSTISSLLATNVSVSDNGVDYGLGFDSGYREGYSAALKNYDAELNQKYEEGVKYGDETGYNRGFNEGVEVANTYTFPALISSVIDVPVKAFTSLFNFEILGVNLANFFFALMTIAIILAIVKLIL